MKTIKWTEALGKFALIFVGSFLLAFGFQYFMYPNDVISGGITGISMIINRLSGFPIGVLTIILNIPIFIIALRRYGAKFVLASFVGMTASSVFIDLLAITGISLTGDAFLACVIGGAIKGLGLGIVYYAGATTGGMDIVVKLVRSKYPYMNFGTIILVMDTVIIVAFALIFSNYEAAMYGIISLFIVSKMIDLALYGVDTSNVCYIVSDKSEELTQEITKTLHRGVTLLHGEGAYSKKEKQVLMCVVKRAQSVEIRKIVKGVDQDAFLILTDAKNVYGHGFGDITSSD